MQFHYKADGCSKNELKRRFIHSILMKKALPYKCKKMSNTNLNTIKMMYAIVFYVCTAISLQSRWMDWS